MYACIIAIIFHEILLNYLTAKSCDIRKHFENRVLHLN